MSEVARLDVLLGADVSGFQSAMTVASKSVVDFSKLGSAASQLKPFSNATASALSAANSVQKLSDVLAQLKIEQAGATSASELSAYNNAIKTATSELQTLGNVGTSSGFGAIGKSLTGVLTDVRQLAYILPGIGVAGIFNLAFTAISQVISELNLFGDANAEATKYAAALNDEFAKTETH